MEYQYLSHISEGVMMTMTMTLTMTYYGVITMLATMGSRIADVSRFLSAVKLQELLQLLLQEKLGGILKLGI